MLVTVLKAFPYSANGITTLHLAPSDKDPPEPVEVRDDLVTGLAAEGFIALEGVAHAQPIQTQAPPVADGAQARPAEVVAAEAEPAVAPVAAPVADLWDVHYVSPHGEWFVDKGLTREAAEVRAIELQQSDEPSPSVRIEPHVAAPDNLTDADLVEAMTEAELRAYLTKRDGKAPHHKIGPAKLQAMAKGE